MDQKLHNAVREYLLELLSEKIKVQKWLQPLLNFIDCYLNKTLMMSLRSMLKIVSPINLTSPLASFKEN